MRLLASLGVLFWSAAQTLAAYNLIQSYSGSNFFQGWDFFDGFDNTTNGASVLHMIMTDRAVAHSERPLAGR